MVDGDSAVSVRPLRERDLAAADRILRVAFGTFLGLPEPVAFMGDANYVHTRWRADPSAAFGAEREGELIGSNFATNWGSVGFFGPLSVCPSAWNQGVAKALMKPIMERFDAWGTRHAGLFTFPHSPKHITLYQQFGFQPRFLTAVMSKGTTRVASDTPSTRYADAPEAERAAWLCACRELTGAVHEGLDVAREIRAVHEQRLGDTVLLWRGTQLVAFAVCHTGADTEAGSGVCYVKFGVAQPGAGAARHFEALLDACETLAHERGALRLAAGVNTARHQAYQHLLGRGFRTDLTGLAMQRPNEPGYNRPHVYLIDDWR